MRYFRNYEIAKLYDVSQATVGKWVDAVKQGKLGLELFVHDGRAYIANTPENMKLMKGLAEERRKYRNNRAADVTTTNVSRLIGLWRSYYTYRSSDRGEDFESLHYVRLYPKGDSLIMETIPEANEAYMVARLTLDGNVATCSWQESTSPKGDYKGAMYHGAGQLIISEDGKSMKGKWVGFGKNMEVKTGPWEFTYLGDDMSVLDDLEIAPGQ